MACALWGVRTAAVQRLAAHTFCRVAGELPHGVSRSCSAAQCGRCRDVQLYGDWVQRRSCVHRHPSVLIKAFGTEGLLRGAHDVIHDYLWVPPCSTSQEVCMASFPGCFDPKLNQLWPVVMVIHIQVNAPTRGWRHNGGTASTQVIMQPLPVLPKHAWPWRCPKTRHQPLTHSHTPQCFSRRITRPIS